jgi:hypothetical protein
MMTAIILYVSLVYAGEPPRFLPTIRPWADVRECEIFAERFEDAWGLAAKTKDMQIETQCRIEKVPSY